MRKPRYHYVELFVLAVLVVFCLASAGAILSAEADQKTWQRETAIFFFPHGSGKIDRLGGEALCLLAGHTCPEGYEGEFLASFKDDHPWEWDGAEHCGEGEGTWVVVPDVWVLQELIALAYVRNDRVMAFLDVDVPAGEWCRLVGLRVKR